MRYREAIAAATVNALEHDPKALMLGVGVSDVKGIFGTVLSARERFPDRIIETPLSENMLTGALCGLALEGYHPMMVHARMDFLPLTFEHLVNTLAKWRFSHGSRKGMGVAIRCIVGRGWGQGPQHSQALHAMLGHVPGLRVLLPFTPQDAYDAVWDAYQSERPTIIMEHRRLYETEGIVARVEEYCRFSREGYYLKHPHHNKPEVTIIGISAAILDCVEAAMVLNGTGVHADVFAITSLSINPRRLIEVANQAQGRVVVTDVGHAAFGLSAEVARILAEAGALKAFASVTPPFTPCPTSAPLEAAWYPTAKDIAKAAMRLLCREPDMPWDMLAGDGDGRKADAAFRGPF